MRSCSLCTFGVGCLREAGIGLGPALVVDVIVATIILLIPFVAREALSFDLHFRKVVSCICFDCDLCGDSCHLSSRSRSSLRTGTAPVVCSVATLSKSFEIC